MWTTREKSDLVHDLKGSLHDRDPVHWTRVSRRFLGLPDGHLQPHTGVGRATSRVHTTPLDPDEVPDVGYDRSHPWWVTTQPTRVGRCRVTTSPWVSDPAPSKRRDEEW